jgi:hypothetical protein
MAKRSQKKRADANVEAPRPESKPQPAATKRKPLPPVSSGAVGSYLGIAFGLTLLGLGLLGALGAVDLPVPLIVSLFLTGPLQMALCWQALHRSRAAWSFAIALSGTAALVFLFSAPKIRDALGLPIGAAVLPSFVALVITWLLASAASEVSSRT